MSKRKQLRDFFNSFLNGAFDKHLLKIEIETGMRDGGDWLTVYYLNEALKNG